MAAKNNKSATPKGVIDLSRKSGVEIVDLKFVDLPGVWQHFSIPAEALNEELFDEGIGFDGSSIRGFQQIQESELIRIQRISTPF